MARFGENVCIGLSSGEGKSLRPQKVKVLAWEQLSRDSNTKRKNHRSCKSKPNVIKYGKNFVKIHALEKLKSLRPFLCLRSQCGGVAQTKWQLPPACLTSCPPRQDANNNRTAMMCGVKKGNTVPALCWDATLEMLVILESMKV